MDKKYNPQRRYHEKVGMVQFRLAISPKTEQDILDAIKKQGSGKQSAYIKRLIREDIARNNKEQ